MTSKNVVFEFANDEEVKKAYMGYVMGGGLFIQSQADFELGEQVSLSITFPGEPTPIDMAGKIIWITPDPSKIMWISTSNTSGENMIPGVGVQITGDAIEKFQAIMNNIGATDSDNILESDTI